MHSTPFLLGVIASVAAGLLVGRVVAWRLVSALVEAGPALVPRLARSSLWVGGAPLRARLDTRYPRGFRWAAARFSLGGFTGLPLTLILVGALYALAMLVGLIDLVRDNAGTVRIDGTVNDFFAPYRADWLLQAFLWITAIGAGPSLTGLLCCATALLWSAARARLIPPLWIAFLGAQATTWSSKYVIGRPRPTFLPHITEWNPSFPSGHATASTALIGMLGYAVACGVPSARARFEVAFWTAVVVALVCFSRLFLGVHFFTDVMAGILVGVFWLLVGYTVSALRPLRLPGRS